MPDLRERVARELANPAMLARNQLSPSVRKSLVIWADAGGFMPRVVEAPLANYLKRLEPLLQQAQQAFIGEPWYRQLLADADLVRAVLAHQSRTLVVVHPGSACGSADYNLGRNEARAARDAITQLCNDWTGHVIVLDGMLSDELEEYPVFARAITGLLVRAREAGYLAIRHDAEDPMQVDVVGALISEHDVLKQSRMTVTGAWYYPDDTEFGCVNSVIDAINALGGHAEVAEAVCSIAPEIA